VAAPLPALPVAVAITPDGKARLVVKSGANQGEDWLDIYGQKVSYAQVDDKNTTGPQASTRSMSRSARRQALLSSTTSAAGQDGSRTPSGLTTQGEAAPVIER